MNELFSLFKKLKRKFSDKISRNLFKLNAKLLLYPTLKKGPEESVL